jgi:branched-chain amino acid transport system ATP-binding protein
MNDCCLSIEGVRKRFGEVEVLAGIDACLRRGQITAFVGPNGAGKTTLFSAITGELPLDSGRVVLDGNNITHLRPWKIASMGIGKVFQDVRVFPNISAVDNVAAGVLSKRNTNVADSILNGETRVDEARRAARLQLEEVGVEGRLDGPAGELSWGNQKLVAFARLLSGDFQVALLDEPVSGVSPTTVERLKLLIRRMASEKRMTVGLIEHNTNFVKDLADWVIVLKDGRVCDEGPAEQVLRKPQNFELLCGL